MGILPQSLSPICKPRMYTKAHTFQTVVLFFKSKSVFDPCNSLLHLPSSSWSVLCVLMEQHTSIHIAVGATVTVKTLTSTSEESLLLLIVVIAIIDTESSQEANLSYSINYPKRFKGSSHFSLFIFLCFCPLGVRHLETRTCQSNNF